MKVGPLDAGAAIRVRAKEDDSAPSISAAVLAFLGEPMPSLRPFGLLPEASAPSSGASPSSEPEVEGPRSGVSRGAWISAFGTASPVGSADVATRSERPSAALASSVFARAAALANVEHAPTDTAKASSAFREVAAILAAPPAASETTPTCDPSVEPSRASSPASDAVHDARASSATSADERSPLSLAADVKATKSGHGLVRTEISLLPASAPAPVAVSVAPVVSAERITPPPAHGAEPTKRSEGAASVAARPKVRPTARYERSMLLGQGRGAERASASDDEPREEITRRVRLPRTGEAPSTPPAPPATTEVVAPPPTRGGDGGEAPAAPTLEPRDTGAEVEVRSVRASEPPIGAASVLSVRDARARVSLEHPTLGPIEVDVSRPEGVVDVEVHAPALGSALVVKASEDVLRRELRASGSELRQFRVSVRREEEAPAATPRRVRGVRRHG